jgi:uncharacterized protein
MKKDRTLINGIPSIIWGIKSNKVVIITHGSQSHKEDRFIQCCADVLCDRGFQIISFDLPEHGDRKNVLPVHTVKQAIDDMHIIMNYAKEHFNSIYVIGCSLGAYYSLLAYKDEPIIQSAFLSPVVDLIELTHEMLENDNRTIQDVYQNRIITLSNGIIVRLEDYEYLLNHKIDSWNSPTSILYGMKDKLIKIESILKFVSQYNAELVISENSAHYFYTEEDMKKIALWLNQIE